ncbi:hypothetical protein DdX_11204 [Ditylenchus destructor]|uniref:Uncharacterized protein n=1 Tax=Ditylenchus destructor TaxID=166010 RepID=A0AAD4MXL5_9BILA|nr:hypothetical protein DdX_11204 [Ditylenchus destructor]
MFKAGISLTILFAVVYANPASICDRNNNGQIVNPDSDSNPIDERLSDDMATQLELLRADNATIRAQCESLVCEFALYNPNPPCGGYPAASATLALQKWCETAQHYCEFCAAIRGHEDKWGEAVHKYNWDQKHVCDACGV